MDFGAFAGRQVNLHHIETRRDFFLRAQESQPIEQPHPQEAALGGINHANGGTTTVAGSAFNLHRHQGITMAAHEIKLAAFTPAPVMAQDFEPAGA